MESREPTWLKLYVHVFIADRAEEFLPLYLRSFVVVDSDLSSNVLKSCKKTRCRSHEVGSHASCIGYVAKLAKDIGASEIRETFGDAKRGPMTSSK